MKESVQKVLKNKMVWLGALVFILAFSMGYMVSWADWNNEDAFEKRGQMKSWTMRDGFKNYERGDHKSGKTGCSMHKGGEKGSGSCQNCQGMNKNGNGGNVMAGENKESCSSESCLLVDDLEYPVAELSQGAKDALNKAIIDEYTALATYEKTIDTLGMVRPFSMIIRAEEQHITTLKALFDKYGIPVPNAISKDTISAPQSLLFACQMGVTAETNNRKLYEDELLVAVREYPDISQVFTNLMNASQDKHLVAFQKCAQ